MTDEAAQPQAGGAYMKLRKRLRRFVEHYVETGNGSEAARRINPRSKRPNVVASKLLARPEVRAAVEEYEAMVIGEARNRVFRTIRQLEFIESFDPRRLLDEQGLYLPLDQWPDEVAFAISGIEIEELFEGRGDDRRYIGRVHKYRVASRVEASKLLLQWKKQLVNRNEHTAKDGAPLPAATAVYVIQKDEAKEISQELDRKV